MERNLKRVAVLILVAALFFTNTTTYAQAQNSISIAAETKQQGQNTIVQVTVSASAVEKIQGISFKLKYDPACLQPNGFQSLVLNLNNTSMPQLAGIVEGIFTSTEPLNADGGMVNVNFTPLKACENNFSLEKADLIVLSPEGFAQPMPNVVIDTASASAVVKSEQISAEAGVEATQSMSVLDAPQTPTDSPADEIAETPIPNDSDATPSPLERLVVIGSAILVVFAGILGAIVYALIRGRKNEPRRRKPRAEQTANAVQGEPLTPAMAETERYLSIRRGIQAGTRIKLDAFPFALGNSPANDLRLEDPSISAFHAKLFLKDDKVILVDLGNPIGTNVNGHVIRNQRVEINNGDVIKIGSVVLAFSVL